MKAFRKLCLIRRIWYLLFIQPARIDDLGLIINQVAQNRPRDPKEVRKEELKARGPQEKPNFLVRYIVICR